MHITVDIIHRYAKHKPVSTTMFWRDDTNRCSHLPTVKNRKCKTLFCQSPLIIAVEIINTPHYTCIMDKKTATSNTSYTTTQHTYAAVPVVETEHV